MVPVSSPISLDTPPRILLVEDNNSIQEVFLDLVQIQAPQVSVEAASTLEAGRHLLNKGTFRLAFLDDRLSDGHGHELLRDFRNPPHQDTVVVDFSARKSSSELPPEIQLRFNGKMKKDEIATRLPVWLEKAGIQVFSATSDDSKLRMNSIKKAAREDMMDQLQKIPLLLQEGDHFQIAAHAHRLAGLAGLLQENQIRQIFETMEEVASQGNLRASNDAWNFLTGILKLKSEVARVK